MKRLTALLAFAFLFAILSGAEAIPMIDGTIAAGEYAIDRNASGIRTLFTLSDDGKTLYAAVEAKGTGWIAIAFGSRKMDGAHMIFAYVKDGTAVYSEQLGRGHTHAATEPLLLEKAVSERAGVMYLELAIPATGFLKGKALDTLAAVGGGDNILVRHLARISQQITFP